MNSEPSSVDQLRLFVERLERLEEDKRGIAEDIKDVKAEAKMAGFDVKTITEILKLRKMDAYARREAEALLDTYKAALGMLDGTPLGRWAVERLDRRQPDEPSDRDDEPDDEPSDVGSSSIGEAVGPAPSAHSIDDARTMGRDAALAGKPVTANPFPPRDVRRSAWDEAWCGQLGSDGMDIPDALKPKPKTRKADDATGAAGGDADEAAGQ